MAVCQIWGSVTVNRGHATQPRCEWLGPLGRTSPTLAPRKGSALGSAIEHAWSNNGPSPRRPWPPATVVEAAARIEVLSGMVRQPIPVGQLLRALRTQPRTIDIIPVKADVGALEACKKSVSAQVSRSPGGPPHHHLHGCRRYGVCVLFVRCLVRSQSVCQSAIRSPTAIWASGFGTL